MKWPVLTMPLALATACGYPEPAPVEHDGAPDAPVIDAATDDAPPIDATVDAAPPDAMPPPVGPSCAGLAATCGPAGNESCCAVAEVPGGSFYRSYDVASDAHNDMGYPATVSMFWLDTYEVTVGRFRTFVEAGGIGTQANPPAAGVGARTLNGMANQGGWDTSWNSNLAADTAALIEAVKCGSLQTWTDSPGSNENKAMNCVTWYEAFLFCAWDGGFLPTEAEWNYAAAGGDEQRAYPWSNPATSTTIDCTYANHYPNQGACNGVTAIARVGSLSPKGDGRWGHADLAGNLWEWVLDWAVWPYPTASCIDCANLASELHRVRRGGGPVSPPEFLRTAFRMNNFAPDLRSELNGVRCARVP